MKVIINTRRGLWTTTFIAVGLLLSTYSAHGADAFDFTTSTYGQASNPAGYSTVFALGHPLNDIATDTVLYFEVSGAYAGETCGDIGNSTRVWTLYEFADSGYSSYLNSADFAHRANDGSWNIDHPLNNATDTEIATTTFTFSINSGSYYLLASYCGSGSGVANTLASNGSYGSNGSGIASWFGSGIYPYSGTPYFYLGGSSPIPPSGPTITLTSPGNGSTTPNFGYWQLTTPSTSLASIQPGAWLDVEYWMGTSTTPVNPYVDSKQIIGSVPGLANFSSQQVVFNGVTYVSPYSMLIPKTQVPDFASFGPTSTWQVEVFYSNSSSSFNVMGTSTFYFEAGAQQPLTCYGAFCTPYPNYHQSVTPIPNPTNPLSQAVIDNVNCPAPGGFTDIGGGIAYGGCELINFAFSAPSTTWDKLNQSLLAFKTTPPVSWFLIPLEAVNSSTLQQASDTDIVYTDAHLSLDGSTSSVVLVSHNWADSGSLYAIREAWFNFVLGLMIIVILLLLALMVILVHKLLK